MLIGIIIFTVIILVMIAVLYNFFASRFQAQEAKMQIDHLYDIVDDLAARIETMPLPDTKKDV